jgi:hypothetical protein
MRIRQKTVVGLALVPIVIALTAGLAQTAEARPATAPVNCQSGALCGFTGSYFSGSYGNLHANNTNLLFSPWTGVDSVYNDGNSCSVTIYTDTNYQGSYVTIPLGYQYGDLQNDAPSFYHHIYSNSWC